MLRFNVRALRMLRLVALCWGTVGSIVLMIAATDRADF